MKKIGKFAIYMCCSMRVNRRLQPRGIVPAGPETPGTGRETNIKQYHKCKAKVQSNL